MAFWLRHCRQDAIYRPVEEALILVRLRNSFLSRPLDGVAIQCLYKLCTKLWAFYDDYYFIYFCLSCAWRPVLTSVACSPLLFFFLLALFIAPTKDICFLQITTTPSFACTSPPAWFYVFVRVGIFFYKNFNLVENCLIVAFAWLFLFSYLTFDDVTCWY